MSETEKGVEEYYRRMIVKLIREAGEKTCLNSGDKSEICGVGEEIIEEDYKLLSKPLEDIFNESIGKVTKGEDLGKVSQKPSLTFWLLV